MLWNRKLAFFVIFLAAEMNFPHRVSAEQICPNEGHNKLVSIDIFDGNPNELADLVAQQTSITSGYFDLGYIYKAGRYVTVRCDYEDGVQRDKVLHMPVKICRYHYETNGSISLDCD